MAEVVAYTRQDTQNGSLDPSIQLGFDRITAAWHNDGVFGEHVSLHGEEHTDERRLALPEHMHSGLFAAIGALNSGESVNCHRFSRFVFQGETEDPFDLHPIVTGFGNLPAATSLKLGSIGVIGVEDYGIPHSLVGLGEAEADSIQVMSGKGEIGFADVDRLMDFYTKIWSEKRVGLYLASDN